MRLFHPGALSLEAVLEPGYQNCPAYNWLKLHGGREGRFEMQTVVVDNADNVYEAVRVIQSGWSRNEFGLSLPSEAASSQGVPNTEGEGNVQVSQASTQLEDSQMALG